MVTISSVVETTAVLSDEQTKRYEYTKSFKNEKGKKVLLIMLNASGNSQIHTMDTTTNLTISNLSELGYTTITIWNLFPEITAKLNCNKLVPDNNNLNYFKKLLKKKFDTIIIGWGTALATNKKVKEIKAQVHEQLRPYEDLLMQIEDAEGKYKGKCNHPLFAGLYFNHQWVLNKYLLPELQTDDKTNNNGGGKTNEPDMEDRAGGKFEQGEVLAMYAEHETETGGTDN